MTEIIYLITLKCLLFFLHVLEPVRDPSFHINMATIGQVKDLGWSHLFYGALDVVHSLKYLAELYKQFWLDLGPVLKSFRSQVQFKWLFSTKAWNSFFFFQHSSVLLLDILCSRGLSSFTLMIIWMKKIMLWILNTVGFTMSIVGIVGFFYFFLILKRIKQHSKMSLHDWILLLFGYILSQNAWLASCGDIMELSQKLQLSYIRRKSIQVPNAVIIIPIYQISYHRKKIILEEVHKYRFLLNLIIVNRLL